MTKEEFNLSEKIRNYEFKIDKTGNKQFLLYLEDVKEFIRKLKDALENRANIHLSMREVIDKLAGEKLK